MPKFNKKQLILLAMLLDEEEKNRKRECWIHPIFLERKRKGEFATLYKQLEDNESKFYIYFRMSIAQFNWLHTKVNPKIEKKNTKWREAISSKEKLAVCLRFLATGDSFQTISFSYRLGHSTVSLIVKEVCKAIVEVLMPIVMPTPTKARWEKIAEEFWEIWDFPNCIGSLDGKRVVIATPSNSGSLFYNYKKTFSVVLLALVDAKYNFVAIDVGSYGKNSDGGIFSNCNLGKALENQKLEIPEEKLLPGTNVTAPHVIVADEAFPLKPYLLRPYPGTQIQGDASKRHFNERLSRARRTVENAFGIMAQKFQIFNRRIKSQPEHVDNIILATCVLHNYIRINSENTLEKNFNNREENKETTGLENLPHQGGNASIASFNIRDTFKEYLSSPEGKIKWELKQ